MAANPYLATLDGQAPPSGPPFGTVRELPRAGDPQPAGNPYLAALDAQEEQEGKVRSLAAWRAANSTMDPGKAADVLLHSAASGLPPGIVAETLPQVKAQVSQDQIATALAKQPVLARYMADAARAPLVRDDVAHLGPIEWLLTGRWENLPDGTEKYTPPALVRAFGQGVAEQKLARIAARQYGGVAEPQEEAQAQSLEAETARDLVGPAAPGLAGWARHAGAGVLVGTARVLPYLGLRFAAAAAGGAAAGAATGGVGALPGALVGGAAFDFYQNVGALYRNLRSLKGNDGLPLLSDAEAKAYATGTSIATSALTAGLGMKVLTMIPPVRDALNRITQQGVAQALTQVTTSRAALNALKGYGEHVLAGAALMASQAAANAATVELAKSTHGQQADWAAVKDATVQAAIHGARDFALIAAWGPGKQFLREMGQAARLERDAAALSAMTDAARESQSAGLHQGESQALYGQMARDGDSPTAHVERGAWDRLWQDQKQDPREAAAEVIGDGGKAYDDAVATGGALQIPTDAYLAKIARSKVADALRPDVKFTEDGLTPREAMDAQKRLQERVDALVKELNDGVVNAASNIRESEASRARAAGVKDDEALAFGTLRAANAQALAERYGGTAPEWIEKLGSLSIVRGGEPGPAALQQPAYHGSPHVFDRFDLNHIGSGEGAQVYGWGLYFAQEKGVAESYRRKLEGPPRLFIGGEEQALPDGAPMQIAERDPRTVVLMRLRADLRGAPNTNEAWTRAAFAKVRNDIQKAIDSARQRTGDEALLARLEAQMKELEKIDPAAVTVQKSGALYHVDVPDSDKLLDWDKKLGDQPKAIQDAVIRALGRVDNPAAYVQAANGRDAYVALQLAGERFGGLRSDKYASEALRAEGVPGLRYLDQGSRPDGKGTHNFVIWDESHIKSTTRLFQSAWEAHVSADPLAQTQEMTPLDKSQVGVPEGGVKDGVGTIRVSVGMERTGAVDPNAATQEMEPLRLGHLSGRGYIEFAPNDGKTLRADIHLLSGADKSTLAHETGHFFTEALSRLALTEGAPEALRADMDALAMFAGYSGLEERAKGLVAANEERIAAAWETYLAEGKAPSAELLTTFARFKGWMLAIYKGVQSIAGAYKARFGEEVGISPEVRSIFDRWLAADSEIAAQSKAFDLAPFKLKPEEEAKVRALDARQEADWVAAMARADTKERRKALAAEREKLAEEVGKELDASPAVRVREFFENGNDPGIPKGNVAATRAAHALIFPEGKAVKLDREALVERYGAEFVKSLPEGATTARDGVHPDSLAEHFGFKTGDDLVRALGASEPREALLDREVQSRLEAQHAELLDNPAAVIERAGASSDVGIDRAILIGQALRSKIAPDQPVTRLADRATYKRMAAEFVAQKKVGDISPNYFRQAYQSSMRQAAEVADPALKMGHLDAAAFSAAAERAARDAREQADSDVAALRKFTDDKVRAKIGLAGGEHLAQVDGLLEHFELGASVSRKEVAQRLGTAEWIAREQAAGRDPIVPDSVLAKLDRQVHWKELTPGELSDLRAGVESIAHQAELKRTIIDGNKRKDFTEGRADLVAELQSREIKPLSDSSEKAPAFGDRVGLGLRNLGLSLAKMEELLRQLGPSWTRLLWNPINDATNRWYESVHKLTKPISDAIDAMPAEDRVRWMETRFSVNGVAYNLADALSVALNLGNKSNLRKLVEGRQHESYTRRGFTAWTDATPREFLQHLTAKDAELVQTIWDRLESLWPEMSALEKRLTGLEPEKVPATPLRFTTSDGKEVTLKGGYYPVMYDSAFPGAGPRGEEAAALKQGLLFDPSYQRALTPQGALIARIEAYARPIVLGLDGLPRHIAQTTKDVAFREAALSVHKILLDDAVRSELQQRAPGYHEQMLSWLRDSVNDLTVPDNGSRSWLQGLSRLRSNVTAGIFAYNIGQTLQNLSGFVTATRYVGVGHMLDSLMTFAKDSAGTIDQINALSQEMRVRTFVGQPGVGEALHELMDRKGPVSRVAEYGLAMFEATDKFVAYRTWWAAFQKAGAEGMPEAEAIRSADSTVRLKVMSGATKDLPALTRSPVGKLFAPLMGFSINRINQLWGSLHDAGEASSDGHKWAAAKILGATLVALALEDIISEVVTGKGPGDENQDGQITAADWARWTAKTAVLAVPKKVPVLGAMIRSMESGRDVSFNPEARVLQTLGKAGTGAWKIATQDDPVQSDQVLDEAGRVLEFGGWALGLPTAQASTTVKYLRAVQTGDETPSGPVETALGVAYGRKRPGKLSEALQ